jgi:hypothetical protein
MEKLRDTLIRQSKRALARSRDNSRRARRRVKDSREQLSRSGNVVVATASRIGAARIAIKRRYRP